MVAKWWGGMVREIGSSTLTDWLHHLIGFSMVWCCCLWLMSEAKSITGAMPTPWKNRGYMLLVISDLSTRWHLNQRHLLLAMGFNCSSTRTNLLPDQWPINIDLVTWFHITPISCQCGFGFEVTTKTGVGEAVGRQRSGQSRFFTRRTKSVGCIASMFGFDWTSHRVERRSSIKPNDHCHRCLPSVGRVSLHCSFAALIPLKFTLVVF